MASPVGLAIRNEKAQQRINDALALLSESFRLQLPDDPVRSRDPFLREMLRMEWTAETLEVLATASIGRVEPLSEAETQAGESNEQTESDQDPDDSADEQTDPKTEQDGFEQEQVESDEEQPAEGSHPHEEPEGEEASQELDPVELKKRKLDDLKVMATERGIEDVQDARSKDEVIEKLMEGSE